MGHQPYKLEMAGGRLVMMAGGSNPHATIAGNIFATLRAKLRGQPMPPFQLRTSWSSSRRRERYYPDATSPAARPATSPTSPVMVVEVLSPTTKRFDLRVKLPTYLRTPGLAYVLYLSQDEPRAWLYRPTTAEGDEPIEVAGLEAEIALPELGIVLTLAELYEDVAPPEGAVGMSADRSFAAACEAVVGSANVLTAAADMEAYAHDFWRIIQGRPALVVRPADTGQVAAVVRLAAEHGVALVPQSGNTGLVGGNVPDESGTQVVLSLARLDRVRAVDAAGLSMVVEAGCTLAAVQETAAAADRLFPLSLGSEGTCRIAGNLASNAGGINVLRYGMARDLVLGLEVVMADGRVWDGLRTLRKDNTGYDLKQLFLGSEGTLGIITAAALKLFPRPRERVTLFLGVSSPAVALDLLARARARFGELVSSFELMAAPCVEASVAHVPGLRFPLESRAPWYVLTEVAWSLPDGLEAASDVWLEEVLEADLVLDATRAQSEAQRSMLWRMREGISEGTTKLGAIARHDISVPVASIPRLIERGLALIAGDAGLPADPVRPCRRRQPALQRRPAAGHRRPCRHPQAAPGPGVRSGPGARRLDQRRARDRPRQAGRAARAERPAGDRADGAAEGHARSARYPESRGHRLISGS